jgi:hypothetical protein
VFRWPPASSKNKVNIYAANTDNHETVSLAFRAPMRQSMSSVTRLSQSYAYLKVRIPRGKQNALEEAPEADSIPSGEARQRSKSRQRIPGPKGRAADSAMLERHAG